MGDNEEQSGSEHAPLGTEQYAGHKWLEMWGGFAFTCCSNESCSSVFAVPYLDAGKEFPCPKCRVPHRIPESFYIHECSCGKKHRVTDSFSGRVIQCLDCNSKMTVSEDTCTVEHATINRYLYISCPYDDCGVKLLGRKTATGKPVQCPACGRALIVPAESTIDPLQHNMLVSEFLPATVELENHCDVCGQPVADTCSACVDREPMEALPVVTDGATVLGLLKDFEPGIGVLLAVEDNALFVAEIGFHGEGDVIRCEFVSESGTRVGSSLFAVKNGAPLVTKRRVALYRLEPVIHSQLWEYWKARVLGDLTGAFLKGMHPAR